MSNTDLTVSMPLIDWEGLMRVQRFASKDRSLPTLASVRVYESGNRLYAEATDRFRAASTVAPESVVAPSGLNLLISTESLTDLERVTKAPLRLRQSLMITLTISKDNESVVVEVSALPGLGDVAMRIPLVQGNYPQLEKIFQTALSLAGRESSEPAAFNPGFLADYKAVAGRNEPIRLVSNGKEPALIQIGDDFISALVPIRFAKDDLPADVWSHLNPPAPVDPVSK